MYSKYQIKEILLEEKSILEEMMQVYFHEMSQYNGDLPNNDGIYDNPYLYLYWEEDSRIPYFIMEDNEPIGFALVNDFVIDEDFKAEFSIAEFYIIQSYRKRNIGKQAAFQIFNKFQGKWEIRQEITNLDAQHFWRKIITEFTKGNFEEKEILQNDYQANVIHFKC